MIPNQNYHYYRNRGWGWVMMPIWRYRVDPTTSRQMISVKGRTWGIVGGWVVLRVCRRFWVGRDWPGYSVTPRHHRTYTTGHAIGFLVIQIRMRMQFLLHNSMVVTFWDRTTWHGVDIVIDERLPIQPLPSKSVMKSRGTTNGGRLLVAQPSRENKFWVPVLEKALAIHCGGYDKLIGTSRLKVF